eukprot:1159966-Pelagomonas_calceolata.AAC.2
MHTPHRAHSLPGLQLEPPPACASAAPEGLPLRPEWPRSHPAITDGMEAMSVQACHAALQVRMLLCGILRRVTFSGHLCTCHTCYM